ncbi:MAG: histidinol dehydrogenase [Gemmatimonadota bacterium]|nr:histidinol dehydrogenase [Gemmatimonadota bacterium]
MTSATMSLFAVRGDAARLGEPARSLLLDRRFTPDPTLRDRVAEIIKCVARDGDAALRALARALDGVELDQLEVPRETCAHALDALDPTLRRVMERAAKNIAQVHRAIPIAAIETEPEPGITVGRRPDPLARVGVYAPGGRAPYPSSVLMGVIPARVAGVREIVLCAPPRKETGRPSDVVLAAAALSGVDRVFAVGGAGAIAAMAYGTPTVPRTDLIVGPGNAYVAAAKLAVRDVVATDAPAGPSELLVIADESADPDVIAREILAQAEHDPDACVVCIVIGASTDAIESALGLRLTELSRASTITAALTTRGALLTSTSLEDVLAFAEAFAPEHLLLALEDPNLVLPRVHNAGTIFLGESSSVTFGDYLTGANHVLPTSGLARCYSGLSTLDFVRWTTYQRVSPTAAQRLARDVAEFADAESLTAHAAAARGWEASTVASEVGR